MIRLRTAVALVLLCGGRLFTPTDADRAIATETPGDNRSSSRALVRVNGQDITESDLQFWMISRGVTAPPGPAVRKQMLEQLIDHRLMQQYLAGRQAEPDRLELETVVEYVKARIRKSGDDPEKVLKRLGMTEDTLRQQLALPLSWQRHVRRMVTDQRLREYFQQHRQQFDGTEVRASMIFIKVVEGDEAARQAAVEQLRQIRADIVAKKLSFAEAARKFSQAPSSENGGDVGFFPYRGKMPEEITRAVFGLDVGEVSEPFVTRFGVHIATVTARKPGDLSLEDVRNRVLKQLADELWDETVRQQRGAATVERAGEE